MRLKRFLLSSFIGTLVVSALVGIFVFLFGSFGELEAKILGTTLCVGLASLTSLCCSTLLENKRVQIIGVLGIIFSCITFFLLLSIIWGYISGGEFLIKLLSSCIVLSFAFAHGSLLINMYKPGTVGLIVLVTFIIIVAISTILITMIVHELFGDGYQILYRLLGVLAILDVLGTVLVPVLSKALPSSSR